MEKKVKVLNRKNGSTGYTIPDTGVRRIFSANESKDITLAELEQLSYVPGGEYLLKNCFIVEDKDALAYLNLQVEPEYFYTEKEIREILLTGSLELLEDTLNFAPVGVIDIIKKIAVSEEIPDNNKRKMIFEKTGFNVNKAIEINDILNTETTVNPENVTTRKTTPLKVENDDSSTIKRKATTDRIIIKK